MTTNDNEEQRVIASDNEWQLIIGNVTTNENE